MKIKLLVLSVILLLVSCDSPVIGPVQPPVNEVYNNQSNPYQFMGGINLYASADEAFSNRNSARPYFKSVNGIVVADTLYDNAINSKPIRGNDSWITIRKVNENNTWYSVKLNSKGVILEIKNH